MGVFVPRLVRAVPPRVRSVAAELLDALPVDLVAAYVSVLTLRVSCDLLRTLDAT